MARKNPKRKLDIRVATRLATAGVFILSAAAVLVTGYFIMSTLNSVSSNSPVLVGEDVRIKTIDSEKLEEVKTRLDEKTRLDAPRQGSLQNPFDIKVQPLPPTEDAAALESEEPVEDPDSAAPVSDAGTSTEAGTTEDQLEA